MFDSSDSLRAALPLPFAETITFDTPPALELGGELPRVTVRYETYGHLNASADNAVLICHALSGDSHVARHGEEDAPGWWDIVVGPGKPIDTEKYFVICPNVLGGCRGSTGPNSLNPENGEPYGSDFPEITISDIVEAQRRLVEHIGIARLRAVVGGSMGGQMVLCWAVEHPEMVAGAVALATAARLSSQALAFDIVGRNAILHDPNFHGGRYYLRDAGPGIGLAIARMIGHITYLTRESMQDKFEAGRNSPQAVPTAFETDYAVGSYLGYQGDRFVERFDANSYLALTRAMDRFDLAAKPGQLQAVLGRSLCRWLVISFSSDWLFPPEQSQTIVDALIDQEREVSHCSVVSSCGHDAFLLPQDVDVYGELVRGFLLNLSEADVVESSPPAEHLPESAGASISIFQSNRLDYQRIVDLIPEEKSVLDLGCGRGELLLRLKRKGCTPLMGVELDEQAIVSCLRRGVPVVQADLNRHLPQFPDKGFDYVVLSQTLQAILDVEGLVDEIIRIGRRGIVSCPNFAYHKLRDMFYNEGRAPESPGVLRYHWYNTPNLRFFSLKDFEALCREKAIRIHQRITLDTEAGIEVTEDPNLNADLAIYVINGFGTTQ